MKRLARRFMAAALTLFGGIAMAQETVEYIHTDALGSPVAVTDAVGVVIERMAYEPYGATLGPASEGPGFSGHVTDPLTGLSYMQQRYHDPELGVFLSVDPVPAHANPLSQFNRYRYGNGNPYRFVDPDGRVVRKPGDYPDQRCLLSPLCRNALSGDGSETAAKLLNPIRKAWRGAVAHRVVQDDVKTTLVGVTVRAERPVKTSTGRGSIDLALRRGDDGPWHVFELKPISQMPPAGLKGTGAVQVAKYVQALEDEGEVAVPGRWGEFFPDHASKWVNAAPQKFGGILFGGSYIYGPADANDAMD